VSRSGSRRMREHANRQSMWVRTMSSNSRSDRIRRDRQRRTNPLPNRALIATGLLVVALSAASPGLARGNFDGDWSVVIETRNGACMPTLRYPVAITNGIVTNSGGTPATVQGRVAPTGAVTVTVQSGGSWARGSGRLTTTGGSGFWRGQGTSGLCEGIWQAERRSYGAQVTGKGAPTYNYAPQPSRPYYPAYPSR
jgi:hypothetical protein